MSTCKQVKMPKNTGFGKLTRLVRLAVYVKVYFTTSPRWTDIDRFLHPVSGVQASSLCISTEFVYALTPEGKMYVRYAITATNPAGNYWKEIPGRFMAFAGILLTC